MDIQVSQGEGGERTAGEDNVWRNRAGVVGAPFGAVGIDYREASGGGVKETVRGEEVKCHDIPPSKKPWQERNSRQKGTINVKGNPGLTATGRGG